MHILHVVHQYLPEFVGGTELYTQSLAEHQVKAGYEVTIFTPTEGQSLWPEPDLEEGVRIYRYPVGSRSRSQVFLQTLRGNDFRDAFNTVLSGEKPDLIHAQHFMGLPASLVDEANAVAIPLVITVHDYWYVCANAQLITNYDHTICHGPDRAFQNCAKCALVRANYERAQWLSPILSPLMAYRNRVTRRIFASARRVIFPSHFAQKIYRELDVPTGNTTVIRHGIEIPLGLSKKSSIRPMAEHTEKKGLRIGYVGSLAWQKGVHNLISAVNRLPEDGIFCDIYGSLNTHPEYAEGLQKMSRHPGIRFAGQISRERLWPKLTEFDVLVMPTMWYESFGLVIQEAFAAKVPVIASRIGAVEENIRDGIDGLLVEPGDVDALYDALLMLYEDPQRLHSLKDAIRPVRTMNEHMDDVLQLYRSVINEPVTI